MLRRCVHTQRHPGGLRAEFASPERTRGQRLTTGEAVAILHGKAGPGQEEGYPVSGRDLGAHHCAPPDQGAGILSRSIIQVAQV